MKLGGSPHILIDEATRRGTVTFGGALSSLAATHVALVKDIGCLPVFFRISGPGLFVFTWAYSKAAKRE
jgi:hypothetical protein